MRKVLTNSCRGGGHRYHARWGASWCVASSCLVETGNGVATTADATSSKEAVGPQIWILFAVIGLLLLLAPSIMTFLINLEPVDHSDNGDGQYLLSGLLLIPCALFGLPTVLLAYCVGIAKRVMWVRAAGPHQTMSLCVGSRDCRYVA